MRMPYRLPFILCMLSALFVTLAMQQPVRADSRDDWLAALNDRADRLATLDPARLEDFREVAVILAEEMNRFTIEETEIRKDDKVPPPDAVLRRPGKTATDGGGAVEPGAAEAGAPVSLSRVPNTWFNYHITEANRRLKRLIGKIEQARKGAVPPGELHGDAAALERSLERLNRPPDAR